MSNNNIKFPYKVNLCYVINNKGELLLQRKARGFGQGKWNGPGGKIEKGETPEESVKREIKEETGLVIKNLEKAGELEFIFTCNPEWNNYCYVFICREYEGEPKDTGEGKLKWFKKEDIPLDKMWDDDQYWLMEALSGRQIKKRFYFDKNGKVLKYNNI